MKVIAAHRARALRHQGQVAGRARATTCIGGLYRDRIPLYWSHFASYRVLIDPEALGYAAGAHDGRLGRARRRRREGRLQGAQDEPAHARVWRPACRRRSTARSTAGGSTPRWSSSARCATACGPDMGILFDVGQEYRDGRHRPARPGAGAVRPVLAGGGRLRPRRAARRRGEQTRTRLCHGEALIRRAGVPAVLRAPRDRRGHGRDAEQRPVRGAPDRRARRPLRHDVQPAQLHEPAVQR